MAGLVFGVVWRIFAWLAVYLAMMIFYFFLRQKFSHRKLLSEALIFLLLVIVNVGFKATHLSFEYVPPEIVEVYLNNLTVDELKEFAENRDVTGFSTMKKTELIKALPKEFEELTLLELQALAKTLNIPSYNSLSSEQLIEELKLKEHEVIKEKVVFADKILYALYDSLGVIQFEGLGNTHIAATPRFAYLTHGLMLITALITASVLASTISYEFYSRLSLWIKRNFKHNIYVFTEANANTLTFAKNIKKTHESKNEKYLIIFSSHILAPFSRKDSLCMEIFGEGFLYINIFGNENKSILRQLGLLKRSNDNVFYPGYRGMQQRKLHFISMGFGDKGYVKEQQNTDIVFKEIEEVLNLNLVDEVHKKEFLNKIRNRRNDRKRKQKNKTAINFYVLSSHNSDVHHYDRILDQIVEKKKSSVEHLYLADLEPLEKKANVLAKQIIDLFVEGLYKKGYSEKNWQDILSKQIDAYRQIDEAKTIYDLINKKNVTINAIKEVPTLNQQINDNYQYNFKIINIERKIRKIKNNIDKIKHKYLNYKWYFQIHIINEAVLTATDFSKKRVETLGEDNILKDVTSRDGNYNALVFGFGLTGKEVTKQLYIDTSYLDNNFVETQFNAVILDRNVKSSLGIFEINHPFFIFEEIDNELIYNCNFAEDIINKEPVMAKQDIIEKSHKNVKANIDKRKEELANKYFDFMNTPTYEQNRHINENDSETKKLLDRLIIKDFKFPVFLYSEEEAFDSNFKKLINQINTLDFPTNSYDAVIISLGQDLENVRLANALIDEIKRKILSEREISKDLKEAPDKQTLNHQMTIAIHIRNGDYNSFIDWSKDDEKKFPYVQIVKFGNLNDIYTYDSIICNKEEMFNNSAYNYIFKLLNHYGHLEMVNNKYPNLTPSDLEKEVKKYQDEKIIYKEFLDSFEGFIRYLRSLDHHRIISYEELNERLIDEVKIQSSIFEERAWHQINGFAKKIKKQEVLFRNIMKALYKNPNLNFNLEEKAFYFANLEHIRWLRVYMSNGYSYKPLKNKSSKNLYRINKIENLLCKFNNQSFPQILFDLINAALALRDDLEDLIGTKQMPELPEQEKVVEEVDLVEPAPVVEEEPTPIEEEKEKLKQ